MNWNAMPYLDYLKSIARVVAQKPEELERTRGRSLDGHVANHTQPRQPVSRQGYDRESLTVVAITSSDSSCLRYSSSIAGHFRNCEGSITMAFQLGRRASRTSVSKRLISSSPMSLPCHSIPRKLSSSLSPGSWGTMASNPALSRSRFNVG